MSALTNTDNLETLLLMSMDLKGYVASKSDYKEKQATGFSRSFVDIGKELKIPDREPTQSFTFDLSEDRLYTTDINLLCNHPFDIMGKEKEVILLFEDQMKWVRFERVAKPKKMVAVGKPDRWLACHFRTCDLMGNEEYTKNIFPVHKSGKAIPAKVSGLHGMINTHELQTNMVLALSMIEDAYRPNTLIATATENSSIIFPVEYGAHKDFLSLREGPNNTPTGRKNPILHFCEKHIRRSKSNQEVEVKRHWRGIDEVEINGMKLKLSGENIKV